MPPVARECDLPGCSKLYVAKRPNSRYCSDTCRKRAQRAGANREAATEPPASGLVAAVESQLDAAGRLESPLGQQALVLARRAEVEGGAGLASLSRELRATMADAMANAHAAADPLDQLRERRNAKRSA